jgi:hypothetical protein
MTLTHEYGLMLIYWCTWLVHILVSLISYDVLLEAYVDITVHEFFMWIGIHIGTYG